MTKKYLIKQISVFLENRKGRLKEVAQVLAEAGVNIRALFLADSSEFGILRLVVNEPEKTLAILASAEFAANETDVFAVGVKDEPGGFLSVVDALANSGIDISYTYAYAGASNKAILFFKVPDEQTENAVKILLEKGFELVEAAQIYGA